MKNKFLCIVSFCLITALFAKAGSNPSRQPSHFYMGAQLGWAFNKYTVHGDFNDPNTADASNVSLPSITKGGAAAGLVLGYHWQTCALPTFIETGYQYSNAGSYGNVKSVGGQRQINTFAVIDAEAQPYTRYNGSFFLTLGVLPQVTENISLGFKLSLLLSRYVVSYLGEKSDGHIKSTKYLFGISPGMRLQWQQHPESPWTYTLDYDYRIYSAFTTKDVASDANAVVKLRVKPFAQHVVMLGVTYHF